MKIIHFLFFVLLVSCSPPQTKVEVPKSTDKVFTYEGKTLSEYEIQEAIRSTYDFANLGKYASSNKVPSAKEKKVIFMGNSIVEGWAGIDKPFFGDNNYLGRGISGQTSQQMLLRFRDDVINLYPKAVVINAGTNDIAENTGPYNADFTFSNIISMAQLAEANGIIPILSSVLPADEFIWRKELGNPSAKIIQLNGRLKAFAQQNNWVYLDYHSKLANERGGLDPKLAEDGVHPTLYAYKIMEGVAEEAVEKAFKK